MFLTIQIQARADLEKILRGAKMYISYLSTNNKSEKIINL